MLSYLKGRVIKKLNNGIILNVSSVGYKVFVNQKFLDSISTNQDLEIWTHHYVREDTLALYGFATFEELELFELLLSISGVGPKSAINALVVAAPAELVSSIACGDITLINQVSGIGKKTAERIVLELKDKVATIDFSFSADIKSSPGSANMSSDEIDALIALGYTIQQAREALSQIDSETTDSAERIRQALRLMR